MNTEKVSVNVNIVDLGKIELLIDKGIYTNKTDFMIKAINNELNKNNNIINNTVNAIESDVHIQFGKVYYDTDKLQKLKSKNQAMKLYVIGRFNIEKDVSISLVKETILSLKVFGPCKIPLELKEYYNI